MQSEWFSVRTKAKLAAPKCGPSWLYSCLYNSKWGRFQRFTTVRGKSNSPKLCTFSTRVNKTARKVSVFGSAAVNSHGCTPYLAHLRVFFLRWKESGFHGWPVFSKRDIVGGPERHRCVWGWSTKVSSPLHASVSRAELYLIGFYVPALCIICLVPPHELSCGNIKMRSKKITLNQSIEFVVHFTIPDSNSRKTFLWCVLQLIASFLVVDCLAVAIVYLKNITRNKDENNISAHKIDEKNNLSGKKKKKELNSGCTGF